jgi:hypothetical protein
MNGNTFLRWLRQLKAPRFQWWPRHEAGGGAPAPRNRRALKSNFMPQLEALEERVVPSATPITPAQLRAAYGVDQIKFPTPGGGVTVGNGAGQTIGIAVIGIDTNIASDLLAFDKTVYPSGEDDSLLLDTFAKDASGNYTVTGPVAGSTKPWLDVLTDPFSSLPIPAGNDQRDLEAAEDVEWAHVIAPMANILLVETGDIADGAQYAAEQSQLGVSVVAVSSSHHPYFDPTQYTYPNVAFVAITGDTGTSVNSALVGYSNDNFPASTPDVIAVGGTTLTLNANGSYGSETGWGFAGPNRFLTSDTASFSPAPSWTSTSGGFSGTYATTPGGSASTAAWTTTITGNDTLGKNDGGLEISATWTASPSNSANAQYTAYLNYGTPNQYAIGTATVNQQLAPNGTAGTLGSSTATFQELFALTGKNIGPPSTGQIIGVGYTITVVLQGSIGDGKLVADAIGIGPDDASGGGISDDPFQPAFQSGLVIHNGSSVISSGGRRSTPDVAFDGDYVNSPVVIYSDGASQHGAGTSLGAPCWGALIAIADQGLAIVGRGPMDTVTALAGLYSLPSSDFHDETSGYNGYSAGPGYDLVTGLGSPIANQLVPDLVDTVIVDAPHFTNSPPNTPVALDTNYAFQYTATGSPLPSFGLLPSPGDPVSLLPTGLTLSPGGLLSGTDTNAADVGQTFTGTVLAYNGTDTYDTQDYSITVDQAPAITNGPATTTAIVGAPYAFDYSTTGFPFPSFTLLAGSKLPPGLTLSAAGILSGTPSTAGTFTGTVDAGNGAGTDATQAYSITVAKASPTIAASPGATVVLGAGVKLTASAKLAGGFGETGIITFTLYGPNNTVVHIETVAVSGNGTYKTPNGFLPSVHGTYQWIASYAGDANNKSAGTSKGSTPEVVVGPGATVVGRALYLVLGNSNDRLDIVPVGASQTGSTGIKVSGAVNNGAFTSLTYTQAFTTIYVVGFGGNDSIQFATSLTIATEINEGDGNDKLQLGNGNNEVSLGNGNDAVAAGKGNNMIVAGNGTEEVTAGATGSTGAIRVQLGNGNNDSVVVSGNGNDQILVGNGNNDNVSLVGNGNEVVQTGMGTGKLHIAGTGTRNLRLGKGWIQV